MMIHKTALRFFAVLLSISVLISLVSFGVSADSASPDETTETAVLTTEKSRSGKQYEIQVAEDFSLPAFTDRLVSYYRDQGFLVAVQTLNDVSILQFTKDYDTMHFFFGLGISQQVTLRLSQDKLTFRLSKAAYRDIVLSFFFRALLVSAMRVIPFTAFFGGLASVALLICGIINQASLTSELKEVIIDLVS